jgi:hypothetical protein
MVDARKPTGKTVCPPWIREAKEIEVLIRKRAVHNTVVDSLGDEENESADERWVVFFTFLTTTPEVFAYQYKLS